MKILYGVQGTGNGHISRAREMAKELKKTGAEVQFLFSGRPKENYFDMEVFGDCLYKQGLTFHIENGKLDYWKTLKNSNIGQFLIDIDCLCLDDYDLIISDYEPITSWAGRCQKKKVIGLGHQYAFNYAIPKSSFNFVTSLFMKWFAPADISIGLHWDNFGQPILPPIIDTKLKPTNTSKNKVVVYLPFEDQFIVHDLFVKFTDYHFEIFSNDDIISAHEHINFHRISGKEFKKHLVSCDKVICNSGFELVSECLFLGKPVLVKPVDGQLEQFANAEALSKISAGWVTYHIQSPMLYSLFLKNKDKPVQMNYPNVAKIIVHELIEKGYNINVQELSDRCWSKEKII